MAVVRVAAVGRHRPGIGRRDERGVGDEGGLLTGFERALPGELERGLTGGAGRRAQVARPRRRGADALDVEEGRDAVGHDGIDEVAGGVAVVGDPNRVGGRLAG